MPYVPGLKEPTKFTEGGFQTGTIFSGAVAPSVLSIPNAFVVGADVMVCSGAGRLDMFVPFIGTLHSGAVLSVTFYDAAAPVSGGPIAASGHKMVWSSPPYVAPLSGTGGYLSSGQYSLITNLGTPFLIMQPFQSGLCVNCRSGQGGYSFAWTPEVQGQ